MYWSRPLNVIADNEGDIPAPRTAHTCVIYKHKLYVFGGWVTFYKYYNDVW
jgi:hypothetical protein